VKDLIQQITAQSAVIHHKDRLDAVPQMGEYVRISYSDGVRTGPTGSRKEPKQGARPVNPQIAYRKPRDPGYVGGYYWPPSIVGLIGLILTNVLATQYVAQHFEYQQALGPAVLDLGSFHFYAPYNWLTWLLRFGNSPEIAVKLPLLLSCGIIVAGSVRIWRPFFWVMWRIQKHFRRIPKTYMARLAGPRRRRSRRLRSWKANREFMLVAGMRSRQSTCIT